MHLIVYKNPLTSTLDSREQIANSSAQWKVVLTFGSIQIDLLMVRETGDEDAFGNLLLGCQQRASRNCSVSLTSAYTRRSLSSRMLMCGVEWPDKCCRVNSRWRREGWLGLDSPGARKLIDSSRGLRLREGSLWSSASRVSGLEENRRNTKSAPL